LRLYVRRSMIFLFLIVFFYRSKTNKNANPREKGYWLLSAPKYECNTSKRKKKHFFYDFLHVRRQNKETKILFMARSRLFLWQDFSWFFFHGEFRSQKKVIFLHSKTSFVLEIFWNKIAFGFKSFWSWGTKDVCLCRRITTFVINFHANSWDFMFSEGRHFYF